MPSRTSFFNRTVFWADQRHFWPLTAGYTLIWLLIMPLVRFTELSGGRLRYMNGDAAYRTFQVQLGALNTAVEGGYLMASLFGVFFAMAAFSYLTNPRATNGLHALPARRETLYVTHYLAGLCAQLVPQALTVLLTAAVLGAYGCGSARLTGLMLAMCLPTVFFYSFGVLCMVFTGQILAAPVFYGILNILAVSLEFLVSTLAGNFLYGWSGTFEGALRYFSPVALMLYAEMPRAEFLYRDAALLLEGEGRTVLVRGVAIEGAWLLWIYAAAGVALAALGLLAYRKRHSEATGSTVAIYWARPVFKYGVSFCAALALGQLLYYIFFGQYRQSGSYSLPGTLLCMAAAGLIGYFAAEMLLKKSFRVWRSGWKGAAAVTAALLALGLVMSLDLTGYEGWAPDPAEVESVHIESYIYGSGNHVSAQVTNENTIRLAIAAHRALANDKARQQSGYGREIVREDGSVLDGSFRISYSLKNGGFARRSYEMTLWASERSDPSTPAGALEALYNDPDITLARTLGKYGYNGDTDPRNLSDLRFTGGNFEQARYNDEGDLYYSDHRDLTPDDAKALYDAILRDVAAGRVSGSIFSSDDPRYEGGFELFATYEDKGMSGAHDAPTQPFDAGEGRAVVVFSPDLRESMTDTLAVLRGMGIEIELWDT